MQTGGCGLAAFSLQCGARAQQSLCALHPQIRGELALFGFQNIPVFCPRTASRHVVS